MPIDVGKYLRAVDLTGKHYLDISKIIATITRINTHKIFINSTYKKYG